MLKLIIKQAGRFDTYSYTIGCSIGEGEIGITLESVIVSSIIQRFNANVIRLFLYW